MSGMTKAERLAEMKRLYVQRAFTDAEMADRLKVDRTTIYRDRMELTTEYPVEPDDEGRYRIVRSKLISEIKVNLHEALTLYLAARKTSRQTRFYQPHAASALEKLAASLRQPMTERLLKTADSLLKQERDPDRIKVIETLTQAWVEQRKVRIRYQRLDSTEFVNHVISPYLIEPSVWTDSVYVIALSDVTEKIMPFKIDRINTAVLSGESFEIPDTFDEQKLFKHAWGIWYGDNKPELVKLRFSSTVTKRVKESIWHPLEKVEDTEDGGCIWSAEVAEWREMLPWVRGWGADVEVLEPKELRAEVIQHVREMAVQYHISTNHISPYMLLWAKADKQDKSKVHRLVYHLIDVGQVALVMWNQAIDAGTKRQFCSWLNCDEGTAGKTLAFLISLHDLGKASPSFQVKFAPMIGELRRAGFSLPTEKSIQSSPHGVVSAWALRSLLPELIKISGRNAKMIASVIGGHHGSWITPSQLMPNALTSIDTGVNDPGWDVARHELMKAMMQVFDPAIAFSLPENPEEVNTMLTVFSGFTSVADWIGSMTEYFIYEKRTDLSLEEYAKHSAQAAEAALSQLGWLGWRADGTQLTFSEMFPFIQKMNTLQDKIVQTIGNVSQPALIILESPTGSGKTEAALYAADTWLQTQHGGGLYIAMPTQATSNQMYERVTKFLTKRYPATTLNIQLVHGAALLEEKKDMAEAQDIYDDDQNNEEGGVRAETWFLPRKRTLLAPFGIGTVDQALMSVLQTRHFFVRMFGLQNKVMVFDEVHAYDTYMSELFKRLLTWLRQIGVSVILLSATLPERTRRDLTAAYLGKKDMELPPAKYPRLTIASANDVQSIPLDSHSSRTIHLEWSDVNPKKIVENLMQSLRNGGCAAVVCNRVQRAQDVYNEIKQAGLVPEDDLILFHARFPFHWRKEIEDKVLSKFGKNKDGGKNLDRPTKAIVVATQVIEQSLDLDFDFMVSDLAPIDLLIQRAGRLHRHIQNDTGRPGELKEPKLLITMPLTSDIPEFGHDEYVYDRSIMLKTWIALKGQTEIKLPAQTTALIEAVYGEGLVIGNDALQREMEEAIKKAERDERKAIIEARKRLISTPDDEDLITTHNMGLEEEDANVHEAFRALTRLAEPGISIICLHRVNGNLYLDPNNLKEPLDITIKPDKELARQLLRRSLNIQNWAVVRYFSENEPELHWKHWKEAAALKYSIPIVFEDGKCKLKDSKYTLALDRQIGLEIQKEKQ